MDQTKTLLVNCVTGLAPLTAIRSLALLADFHDKCKSVQIIPVSLFFVFFYTH